MRPGTQNRWQHLTRDQDVLTKTLDRGLSRHAQLEFALEFYSRWIKLRHSELDEELRASIIPSHYYWTDVVKLHLHWLLTQWGNSEYERFGISETAVLRLHIWVRDLMENWEDKHVYFRDIAERKAAAIKRFPRRFSAVTLILDGKAFPLRAFCQANANNLYYRKMERADYMCYKHKPATTSMLLQIIVDPDMHVCYVNNTARPAGHWNDPKQWKLCIPELFIIDRASTNTTKQ